MNKNRTPKILKICNMLKNKCVTVTENFIFRKAILQYLKLLRLKSQKFLIECKELCNFQIPNVYCLRQS
jgi:hypothetical protein